MIHKSSSSQSGHVRVTFELPACVWADKVFLVGDFNEWNETATPFRQDRNGVWRATVDLPADKEFQFRYLVDGNWRTDNHADSLVENLYHSTNSVIKTTFGFPADPDGDKPSMVHDIYREAVTESFHRQLPPNRRAA
ncbi:MAG: hypothetical protein KBG20_09810 [Caldilineaceae bacterium]|nr:hypothetical protein [Caldilineaceae bacterium]MBP8107112.1 hypothetical protein [Caldilineaceae bacterium]MBP8123622.1 hypothetical protein [Caldilineaceae bacterium]MBP9072585.1 hypothetical protein [Caldilineaceae bacterium]